VSTAARTPPVREGTGWYVYGAVPAAEASTDPFAGLRGVNPSGEVTIVVEGPVAALVSPVPLAEFGAGAIDERLRSPDWLEEKVRAHEAVLEAALHRSAVVPFRFGAIYHGEHQIRQMLRDHDRLGPTLERLRGTVELGVKGFLDPARFRARRGEEEPEGSTESGRAYLMRKQRDRELTEDIRAFHAACAQESHQLLAAAARESRLLPLQPPEVSPHDGDMFLNAAYLVDGRGDAQIRSRLADLESAYREDGVGYELTGPWPPYNFVEDDG
jgi:gas vesicle protein GvpL/GvpF